MKRIVGSGVVLWLLPVFGMAAGRSEIADALMRNDKAAVRQLVEQHADVNAPQPDGATALHWAVFRSDKEMVEFLLHAGANAKAANREGATPLWLASINGDAAIIAALLNAGADANEHLPLGRSPLMAAARTGKVDAIKALLDHGADVNAKETLRGTTPLMWAADEGHAAAIQLLIQRGADFKARSDMTERGRGPALGKSNDPRKAVAAQAAALAAGKALGLEDLAGLRDDPNGIGGQGRGGAAGRGGQARGGRGGAGAAAGADQGFDLNDDAAVAAFGFRNRPAPKDGGALTPLVYAVRANDLDSVKALLAAGADVNQVTGYGWSPLLVATQNRYYKLGAYLLDHGADVNLTNKGAWTPLYLATDNRNIESGDYPVRKPDMDHLDYIKILLDKGANVNARMKDSTETRTVFTNQWLDENGATAFLRASQSGDIVLMKLLLAHGADPKIDTTLHVTALHVAAGIGWVEGITYEWSPESTLEAVKMLLDLGLDVNAQADTGRTALHGAAHKGRTDVIQVLVDHGAKLDVRDYGNTDNRGGKLAVHTWEPVDYADGLVRVGVQSAIPHPEAGLLLRKLMTAAGLPAPPVGRTLESICVTDACE
ncbi:MAG TPA: ankyrin repeat domain-containing protein [Bryobacteraceae bacterium]|jgi:ankyrin repeat protein|nr:ankyrin repeat domain-containing protein [Bryobacteraceae bacterium]